MNEGKNVVDKSGTGFIGEKLSNSSYVVQIEKGRFAGFISRDNLESTHIPRFLTEVAGNNSEVSDR